MELEVYSQNRGTATSNFMWMCFHGPCFQFTFAPSDGNEHDKKPKPIKYKNFKKRKRKERKETATLFLMPKKN